MNHFSATQEAQWADWAAKPNNWGQVIVGSQRWMTFQEVMNYIHEQMDEDMLTSGTIWMQKLSGVDEDLFPFAEWEMVSCSREKHISNHLKSKDGINNGFGLQKEKEFWEGIDGCYRDFASELGFFEKYKEGSYSYNAGGVIAIALCMHHTDYTSETFTPNVDFNDLGEKFDECFTMFYTGIKDKWSI